MHIAARIKLIYFVDNPRRICHVSVTFLILQRTAKYPNEKRLQSLHLLHVKKQMLTNFDIHSRWNTGHYIWEFSKM